MLGDLPAWAANVTVTTVRALPPFDRPSHRGVLWSASPLRFRLDIPDVATYEVTNGDRIAVLPAEGSDLVSVDRFLQLTPIAALALQRGLPVLHAGAVAHHFAAVALSGDSTTGKSALSGALEQQHGWTRLADDILPVGLADTGGLVALPTLKGADAVPLGEIWWLDVDNEPGVRVRDIIGVDRFAAIRSMAYNSRIAEALLDRPAFLRIAGALAGGSIPIRRLWRQRGIDTLEEVTAVVARSGARIER